MGLRSAKLRADKGKSPWGCLTLAALPIVLFGGLIAFIQLGRDPEAERRERSESRARVEAVRTGLELSGYGVRETSVGTLIVTLPTRDALEISPLAAKELALTIHSRTDRIVRVETPAGQVLAQAP